MFLKLKSDVILFLKALHVIQLITRKSKFSIGTMSLISGPLSSLTLTPLTQQSPYVPGTLSKNVMPSHASLLLHIQALSLECSWLLVHLVIPPEICQVLRCQLPKDSLKLGQRDGFLFFALCIYQPLTLACDYWHIFCGTEIPWG